MDPLTTLPPIDAFQATGLRKELEAQIEELATEINRARDNGGGLKPETVKEIERDLLVSRVHESNAIEGNTLDRRETLSVMMTGEIVTGNRRASEEVLNLMGAIEQAQSLTKSDRLSESDVRGLHAILMRDLIPDAGKYRRGTVAIGGAKYQPPEADAVPPLMHQLVEALNDNRDRVTPLVLACFGHWSMARIHPFTDGNGRMSRLIQDLLLLQRRLVPVVVPSSKSNEYYAALQQADEGRPQDFMELIAGELLLALSRYKAAIDRTVGRTEWVKGLAAKVEERRRNTQHAKYMRWKSRMAELRSHFEAIAKELNDSVDDFRIRVKDFGGISFEQYQQIVTSGKASRTWDYSISFQFDDQMLRFVFWYGSHHRDGWDTVQPDREPVLLVSIEEGDNYFRLLDETGEQHVSLREVGFVKDQFVRVRRVPGADKREFDLDIAPVDVAKAFYTEVITNKLGLA